MKKALSILLGLSMMVSMAACGSTPASNSAGGASGSTAGGASDSGSNQLVVYTAGTQEEIDAYIPGFEAATGIDVEIVTAGTGELLNRIEAEAENPLGDVLFGGTVSVVLPYKDYFEPYTSANEDAQIDSCKVVEGRFTSYNILPICMVVNTDLLGDLEINGYDDLLQPELKGKIAFVDPAQSSTGLQHLTAMLALKGADDEEKGWEYIEKFVENLDGKLLSSSGEVPKRVAEGEYVVGLTHELQVKQYIDSGYPVERVYQDDGMFVSAGSVQIIKGCKNMENAKKFVDYVTSLEAQTYASEQLSARGTRNDVPAPEGMVDVSEMNIVKEDVYNTLENSQNYLERFKDIYTA